MQIKIKKPYSLNKIGGRENNEDAIFPPLSKATEEDVVFMVCDGVGGHEKGEIASNIVTDSLGFFFHNHELKDNYKEYISEAVSYAQEQLDHYIDDHPSSRGMGTTLAMIWLTDNGIISVHIGDSRVYHIRNGKILFQSSDHSLVNALVKLGEITEEAARTHPDKNKILQCLQGSKVSQPVEEVHMLTDILPGDSFLLCSDGILEQFSNQRIEALFRKKMAGEERIMEILQTCEGKTKDNFSAYVIDIESVDLPPVLNLKKRRIPQFFVYIILAIGLLAGGYYVYSRYFDKKADDSKEPAAAKTEVQKPETDKKDIPKKEIPDTESMEEVFGVYKYRKNNKFGLKSLDSNEITKPVYDELIVFMEFSRVKKDGLYGLISNANGQEVIACKFSALTDPYEVNGKKRDTIYFTQDGKPGKFVREGSEWRIIQQGTE
jgi:protein phosphatase